MQRSPESSASKEAALRGRILKVSKGETGYSSVKLDNGPFRTVTIHCHAEGLGDLLESDMQAIIAHLHTRQEGHFRTKRKK